MPGVTWKNKAGSGEETGEFACTDKGLTKGDMNVRVRSREELLEQRGAATGIFEGSILVCLCIWMCLGTAGCRRFSAGMWEGCWVLTVPGTGAQQLCGVFCPALEIRDVTTQGLISQEVRAARFVRP